jgi:F-type H+-transporting ATPase subunit b
VAEIFEEVSLLIEEGLYSVINRPDIVLLNILALFVLLVIVRKFFWERITNFVAARQAALTEALSNADLERQKAKEMQEKAMQDYEHMKQETTELKDKLMKEAYRQQEELITSAKQEAKRRLEQAEKDIQFEVLQANDEIKESIKKVAFAAAEKIVKREIDEDVHQDIIDEVIQTSDIK